MATVWVARLTGKHGFEKLVAVKTILPQYADDPEFRSMFLDEARLAARIRHPNVAEILDLGEEDETLFIVMEWVDGDSLARLYNSITKSNQRFPLNVLVKIAADSCAGLHAAHELADERGQPLNVVHRDVSPQNILIGMSGVTKVIDFGVAKAAGRLTQETSAGLVKGKIQYASPEQAMGRQLDRRADIWALGTVLYQVLSGKLPYDGENQLATLHLLTSGKPPKPLPPHIPQPLQNVVRKALAFKPEERFASAREMQLALESCLSPAPTTAEVAAVMAQFLGDRAEARKHEVSNALAVVSSRQQMPLDPGASSGRHPVGAFPGSNSQGHGAPAPMVQAQSNAQPQTPAPVVSTAITPQAAKGGLSGKHLAIGAGALLVTASVWAGVGMMAMKTKAELVAAQAASSSLAEMTKTAIAAPTATATAEAKPEPTAEPVAEAKPAEAKPAEAAEPAPTPTAEPTEAKPAEPAATAEPVAPVEPPPTKTAAPAAKPAPTPTTPAAKPTATAAKTNAPTTAATSTTKKKVKKNEKNDGFLLGPLQPRGPHGAAGDLSVQQHASRPGLRRGEEDRAQPDGRGAHATRRS